MPKLDLVLFVGFSIIAVGAMPAAALTTIASF